ncbi:MAG: 6-phosphogluconolactonase [Paraprevotella sp.]|nr:6-phosphogluconolactonase [Paraprevotella sp.]
MKVERYASPREALHGMTARLRELMAEKPKGQPFHLALSGGHTAELLFKLWREEYARTIRWADLRFYWVDERCVPPDDEESNYGHARRMLFSPLGIPPEHIQRIRGEALPCTEAARYTDVVTRCVPQRNGLPVFDCILLGVGTDGHTASLFPDDRPSLTAGKAYIATVHPQTGQHRISLSGSALLNGSPLLLPVVGEDKKEVTERLMAEETTDFRFPAAFILKRATDARLYVQVYQ